MGEVFSRAAQSGAQGLATDVEYFKAIFNTATGDEKAAARNIEQARYQEELAEPIMADIQSFEQFLAEPTFAGFITQATSAVGQITPSAVSTIAGAGIGGVAAVAGRGVLSGTGKLAARRVARDALEKEAKGIATPDESQLANEMYKYFRRGALGGAFTSEYVPLSGSNLSEALDSGKELDSEQAFRAAVVGAPQAAVGVLGEVALLKLVGNVAGKRAAKEGGIFNRLATDIAGSALKGGVIEGTTEFVQEGISVANRFDLDDNFTAEEAQLRLAEATFAGFLGGKAAGAAGGTLGAAAGEAKRIFDKSRERLKQTQEQRVDEEINAEQFGETDAGVTTPEPKADLNAQLDAIHDSNSTKQAVWIAGEQGKEQFPEDGRYIINDKVFHARYVPGRGTIVTKSEQLADEVVKSGASEEALAEALGYTSTKVDGADLVVEALDANGNVVSAELTTAANLGAAQENAAGLSPLGSAGVRVISADQALETRKRKLDDEAPRAMDIPDEVREAFEGDPDQIVDAEETFIGSYAPRKEGDLFPGEQAARDAFLTEFGNDSRVGQFSQKLLETAVAEQKANPSSIVSVVERDGKFEVVRQDFDKLYRFERDGKVERLPLQQFLERQVGYAQGAPQQFRNAVLVRPDGTKAQVSLVSLVNAGRLLVEGREGTQFTGSGGNLNAQRTGMAEMFADLAIEGYDLQDKNGVSLLNQANYGANGQFTGQPVTAAIVGGKPQDINYLMNRTPRSSEVTASEIVETVERDTTDDDALPTDFGRGRTETIRRDFDPEIDTRNTTEEDPNDVAQRAASTEMETEEVSLQEPTRDEVFGGNPDRRRGTAPTTQTPVEPTRPVRPTATWESDPIVKGVHDELQSRLNLDERPLIVSFSMLQSMSDAEVRSRYAPPVAAAILNMRRLLTERSTAFGYYDRQTNTIVVKETGNSMQDALVLAHELGHALFRQEQTKAMANPALRSRLEAAYKANKKYDSYERFENGFEEWYADQVARWASKQYINRQARNLPERHFKKLARRLKDLFNSITRVNFKRRFANYDMVNETFEQYIEGTLDAAARHSAEANTQTMQQTMVPDIVEQVQNTPGARSTARAYEKATKSNLAGAIRSLLLPADNILRRVAGDEIADMFYVRAQDLAGRGKLGFLRATNTTIARWKNRFEREIGDMSSQEVQDGFAAAFASTPTAELTGVARQIRDYLEAFYDEYIEPSNTGIGKRPDYFPISLNLFEITERRAEFKQLLLNNDPDLDPKTIDAAIDRLVKLGQSIEEETAIDPTNPAAAVEQTIRLTANIDRELLGDFVNSPDAAFIDYMRHVIKRVEFNKATGGPEALRERLAELSDEDRKTAEDVIASYLGYQKEPIAPWMRKLNSWGQFLQFVTILPFATIASLPDLAGPIINHKDFSGLWTGFKQIAATIKNKQEAEQLARDIGVVTSETVANAWVTQAEQDYMDPMVRKLSDGYFRLIGLDFFTKFSREFASNMGVQFLLNHARNKFNNPNSARYLQELGVTAEEVLAWNENRSFDTPEGAKVRDALARFVESSIMRPNAAERPVWASDPRWALVWQLKGYFYSYYKTIMGGVLREAEARTETTTGMAQLTAVASVLLLTAVATMPLAMLGMELREYAKNGLAWLLPGVEADQKYFRSDKMDWDDYWFEIIEKSGFLGPLSMAQMAHQNSEWGGSAIFSLLGPTAETVEEVFQNGWRVDRTLGNRLIPIYSQL
jgi:hypothetical protein